LTSRSAATAQSAFDRFVFMRPLSPYFVSLSWPQC
jgi:hypothetical protein